MAIQTKQNRTPKGARLEVLIEIDQDIWDEQRAKGYTDEDLTKAIAKSITFEDCGSPTPPVFDIESVTLLNYY